jgi:hypothetical protein
MIPLASVPGFCYVDIQKMPYSLVDDQGGTLYWDESYLITVDEVELRIVLGEAEISGPLGTGTINWDPEILSINLEGDEIMRRLSILDFLEDDPIVRMPFLGLGGLVSPHNYVMGLSPRDPVSSTLTWISEGEDGVVAWKTTQEYSAGDQILWLNRTFLLNSSLSVECEFRITTGYRAIEQVIRVTNGNQEQELPFPLETSFSLGRNLEGSGISLPDMVLSPERYFTYPAEELPADWLDASSGLYELPELMWKEDELPGMLYLEFDLAQDRRWFGVGTVTELSYELKAGVGVKVISTDGLGDFRPYCIFISGPEDHVVFGFKPAASTGPYDDFQALTIGAGETASLDVLWSFPETLEDTMNISDLEEFARATITVAEFHGQVKEAEQLFKDANALAAEGRVEDAILKAQESFGIYRDLQNLSAIMINEAQKVNGTVETWESAAADPDPVLDKGSRAGIFYSILLVVCLMLALAGWVYVIKPRRTSSEE